MDHAEVVSETDLTRPESDWYYLASERSERDTIRGVQIRAYIYMCMEVRMP